MRKTWPALLGRARPGSIGTGGSGTVDAAAAPVINHLRKDPTTEIGLTHETFAGMPSLRWEFTDVEQGVATHKLDEFSIDPNRGREWGVLVQAPESAWTEDAQPLDSSLQSFYPN